MSQAQAKEEKETKETKEDDDEGEICEKVKARLNEKVKAGLQRAALAEVVIKTMSSGNKKWNAFIQKNMQNYSTPSFLFLSM